MYRKGSLLIKTLAIPLVFSFATIYFFFPKPKKIFKHFLKKKSQVTKKGESLAQKPLLKNAALSLHVTVMTDELVLLHRLSFTSVSKHNFQKKYFLGGKEFASTIVQIK